MDLCLENEMERTKEKARQNEQGMKNGRTKEMEMERMRPTARARLKGKQTGSLERRIRSQRLSPVLGQE